MNITKAFLKTDLSINQSIEKYDVDLNEFNHEITLRSSTIVFITKSINLK